jgi:hypothetical protein
VSTEEKKDDVAGTPKSKKQLAAELVASYCAAGVDIIMLMKRSVMEPRLAYGALYICLKTLRVDFKHLAESFDAIEELVNTVMQGEGSSRIMRSMRDLLQQNTRPGEVMDAILILPYFKLGTVTISESCKSVLSGERVGGCLQRHARGEWGPFIKGPDLERNERNMGEKFGTLTSIWRIDDSQQDDDIDNKFYIVTEADRSATRIFMPKDN